MSALKFFYRVKNFVQRPSSRYTVPKGDVQFPKSFDDTCAIEISPISKKALLQGNLKLRILQHGGRKVISGANIKISALRGSITIYIGGDNARVSIGRVSGAYDIRMWRSSSIVIGDNTTCNGARFMCDQSSIKVGEDCMFSDSIILQAADQHGIVDLESKKIVNNSHKSISLGDHVWVGRSASLLYGAEIGSGAIIGLGAIVNSRFPKNCLLVGVPAKAVKTDVTWCMSQTVLDSYATAAISEHHARAEAR